MAGKLSVHIRGNADDLARSACEQLTEVLTDAIDKRGTGSLVLSGGQTPRRVYQLLASPSFHERLDWKSVHLYFGDERMVPPDHPDSNFGMAKHELISHVPVPDTHVHRMRGELPPEDAANEYAAELESIYKKEAPRFDCVMLGIGEDGHTASLFPGTSALRERKQWVSAVFVPRLNAWRLTLTLPVVNNARQVMFLAEGEKKASIVRKVIHAGTPTEELPATLIHPERGELHWMLDTEAAALLSPSRG